MAQWQVVDDADSAFEFIKIPRIAPTVTIFNDPSCEGGLNWRVFRIMAELVDGFEFLTQN